ncbi:MAG: SWIM zinc finger family protein, partial [Paraburkholderia hospita]
MAEVMSRCDEKTFARGKAYFHGGKVSRLEEKDGGVRAIVRGTEPYNVELTTRYGGLTCYCDCPVSRAASFCKHAVAVALSWLENSGTEVFQPDEETQPKKPRKKRKTYAEQVHEYVASLDADALRTWLMEAVERDVALRDKLLLAARSANASDLPGMKSAVRQATRVRRVMHDWR